MSSLRNIAEDVDPQDAYLDAARTCILDVGWRRTTLTEVARRAGVSRMTIYRRWPDMPALLSDLMTREWGGLVATVRAGVDGEPGPRRIAAGVAATARTLRDNDLFLRIVELDPELLLPYLLSRRGRSQQAILDLMVADLAAAQAAGTVRHGSPQVLARAVLLAAHGFVLSAHTMTDDEVSGDDLDAALLDLVERMLAP
jgi:AcrR family transcriptional regulator